MADDVQPARVLVIEAQRHRGHARDRRVGGRVHQRGRRRVRAARPPFCRCASMNFAMSRRSRQRARRRRDRRSRSGSGWLRGLRIAGGQQRRERGRQRLAEARMRHAERREDVVLDILRRTARPIRAGRYSPRASRHNSNRRAWCRAHRCALAIERFRFCRSASRWRAGSKSSRYLAASSNPGVCVIRLRIVIGLPNAGGILKSR